MDKQFFSVNEFADLLKISHQTVRRAVKDGRINAIRIGGKRSLIRIPASEIERLGMFNLSEVIKKIIGNEILK